MIEKPFISIIPFTPKHGRAFHDLNMEWITKYFEVEEKDRQVLSDPQKYIIDPGGQIIMAVDDKQIAVGTVGMVHIDTDHVELSKMGVSENHQGLGIGKVLIKRVIADAKKLRYKTIILYSNSGLGPAIHLYRKFGFKEIPLEENFIYVRSDIKMKLDL